MVKYLLDSSAVIDILREEKITNQNMNNVLSEGNVLAVCPTVYYEVVRGFKIANATKKFEIFLELCKSWEILPFDMKVAQKSAEIYEKLRKGQQIEDNDVFVAATAIVNDCILVTSNTRHFQRVESLNFVNWRE